MTHSNAPLVLRYGVAVLAVLAIAAALVWWFMRSDPATSGLEIHGAAVQICQGEALVSDSGLVDAVLADTRASLAAQPVDGESPDLVAGSLREALRSARERHAPPQVLSALAALGREQVQVERLQTTWDVELALTGKVSYLDSRTEKAAPSSLRPGAELYLRWSVQVAPWPRRPGVLPHPELAIAQARVEFHSAHSGGSAVADALAEALVRAAAERIHTAALARGLSARLRGVPR
ncbi:MAG: hypothetical protein IT458_05935 [Planctomycetes bacterium]|nr:hypothetical protein [Planctomycetota bacterium]